jgi:hypothetical protein
MAKDPGFVFYPGDYLRDTQCLSSPVQVAYDRIMCEHMRNICVSQKQLDFFTKKLSADEITELLNVLEKIDGGYQISWVAESINKRRAYSESRRQNRKPKPKEDILTYDEHMDNEIEIDNEDVVNKGGAGGMNLGLEENLQEIRNSHTVKATYQKNHKYSEDVYYQMLDDFEKMCREKEYDGSLKETKLYLSNFNRTWKINKSKETNGTAKTDQRQADQAERDRQNELARGVLNGSSNTQG